VIKAGCLASAAATARPGGLVVVLAALLLGSGYGMSLVFGLREVERLAPPDELAGLVAIYYSLCYSGLAGPYLLALVATSTGYPAALSVAAALVLLVLALVLVQGRRHPAPGRS
jgi:predicted MFS family arabinose efflux permease